jgi:hypothetical protein
MTVRLRLRRAVVPAVIVGWLAAIGLGMHTLLAYSFAPGRVAEASARWPESSGLARDRSRPTLVMFAHPRCPCSRASVGELAQLMTNAHGRLAARVVVVRPAGTPEGWERTDIWTSAAAIPGVIVVSDAGGIETSAFGAFVSGQAFLYAADGRLLVAGGLTLGRGHAGDNPGRDAFQSWLDAGAGPAHTPVFGCTLRQDAGPPGPADGIRR